MGWRKKLRTDFDEIFSEKLLPQPRSVVIRTPDTDQSGSLKRRVSACFVVGRVPIIILLCHICCI